MSGGVNKYCRSKGAALIECILVLPLLLILCAGMVDVGSFFFQLQLASDAARYGARQAVLYTTSYQSAADCSDLKTIADEATTKYMTQTLRISTQAWELAEFTDEDKKAQGANICMLKTSDMDFGMTIIKQGIRVKETIIKTCLFCYMGQFLKIKPHVIMAYLLTRPCCTNEACDDPPPLCKP